MDKKSIANYLAELDQKTSYLIIPSLMVSVGFKRLIFNDSIKSSTFESFLIRSYEQIIVGIWALIAVYPLESIGYILVNEESEINHLSFRYFITFCFTTSILLLSSFMLPKIRKLRLRRKLSQLYRKKKITLVQKDKIKHIISRNPMCQSFLSVYGLSQFSATVVANSAYMAAYYVLEYIVNILHGSEEPWILVVLFSILFVVLSALSWKIDIIAGRKIEKQAGLPRHRNNDEKAKEIIASIMEIASKDSFNTKINQLIINNIVDDIYKIMQ